MMVSTSLLKSKFVTANLISNQAEIDALAKEIGDIALEKGLNELSLEGLGRALKSGTCTLFYINLAF